MAWLHIDDYLDLDVDPGRHGAPAVVSIVGELDVAGCPQAQAAVEVVLGEAKAVVLDLSQVTFFSAAGIGLVLGLQDRALSAGADFVVRDPHPSVMRLFTLAGVAAHVRLEQDGA